MEVNPFLEWVRSYPHRHGWNFYIPDDSMVTSALQAIGIESLQLTENTDTEKLEIIKMAFVNFWKREPGLNTYVETVRNGGLTIPVVKVKEYRDIKGFPSRYYTVCFINDILMNYKMATMFRRIFSEVDENECNPFTGAEILPDISILPNLYEKLGVSSFEEIGISGTGDYRVVWNSSRVDEAQKMEQTVSVWVNNYQFVLDILWWKGDVYYVKSLPEPIIDKLKEIMIHNRKITSLPKLAKDIFRSIASHLKGKDLINLCMVNRQFNEFANSDDRLIFRQKLLAEFGRESNLRNQRNPRQVYAQAHRFCIALFNQAYYDSYRTEVIFDGIIRPEGSEKCSVVLIPSRELKGDFELMYFVGAPELSFLASERNYDVTGLYETDNLEKYTSKENIIRIAGLFVGDVASPDWKWLIDLTGESNFRAFRLRN